MKFNSFFVIFAILISLSKSKEWRFDNNFKFGVATSAYQIEGAWNADGKGAGIWDVATHNGSVLIKDRSNADIACDSYNKWEEDIDMLKHLEVNYYRMSLSWTRIFPDGFATKLNPSGVNYYNKIINGLLKNGVQPILTLYHWNLPQVFSAMGGWSNPVVIEHFTKYARTAFALFGDRVKIWITINEPRMICNSDKGLVEDINQLYPLGIIEYLCGCNILKAHAEAYHMYDREFRHNQNGRVSLSIATRWSEPANRSNFGDIQAAKQRIQFENAFFTHPILKFDLPEVVVKRVAHRSKVEGFPASRLPALTFSEKMRIKGTYDFLGVNHYRTYLVQAAPEFDTVSVQSDMGGQIFEDPAWKGAWNKIVPWGLKNVLKWIKEKYNNPEILITENGYGDWDERLEDQDRVNFFKAYLNATLQAIFEDGVNVKAYLAWSLMDNFEWKEGYSVRFGLYHVNFTDPNRLRTPRRSATYFKNVIQSRTIN